MGDTKKTAATKTAATKKAATKTAATKTADSMALKDAALIGRIEDAILDRDGAWIRKDADGKIKDADWAANGPGRIGTAVDLAASRDAIIEAVTAATEIGLRAYARLRDTDKITADEAASFLGAMAACKEGMEEAVKKGLGRMGNAIGNSNGNFIKKKTNDGSEFITLPLAIGDAAIFDPDAFRALDEAIANAEKLAVTDQKRIKRKKK